MPESASPQTPGETAELPPAGGLFFRYRNALGVAIAILLVLVPWGRADLEPWNLALGVGLVTLGVALRLWCILQIGGSARKTSRLKAVRIISWGPYAMVRNPIYVANTTVFAGFTVLSGLLWALPLVVLAFWAWYDGIVRREERFLEERFPEDYGEYERSTRRWIPSFHCRRRPPEVPPYPFFRALKRERGHLLLVSAGLLAVIMFRVILRR